MAIEDARSSRPGQKVDRVVAPDVLGHRPFDLRPNVAQTRSNGRPGPAAQGMNSMPFGAVAAPTAMGVIAPVWGLS